MCSHGMEGGSGVLSQGMEDDSVVLSRGMEDDSDVARAADRYAPAAVVNKTGWAIKLCNNRATPARCKVFTPTAKSPQCRPAPRRFSQDKQVYLSPEGRRRKHCARVPDNRNFDQTGDPT